VVFQFFEGFGIAFFETGIEVSSGIGGGGGKLGSGLGKGIGKRGAELLEALLLILGGAVEVGGKLGAQGGKVAGEVVAGGLLDAALGIGEGGEFPENWRGIGGGRAAQEEHEHRGECADGEEEGEREKEVCHGDMCVGREVG
jgi:hypothetical protein